MLKLERLFYLYAVFNFILDLNIKLIFDIKRLALFKNR